MDIKVTVTLEQIYQVLCPECKERVLDLAAKTADVDAVKANLKAQFERKGD